MADNQQRKDKQKKRGRELPRLDKISVIDPIPQPDGTWLILVAVADQCNNVLANVPVDFIQDKVETISTNEHGRAEHTAQAGKLIVQVSASFTKEFELKKDTRPPKPPAEAPSETNWFIALIQGWQDGRARWKEMRK